MPPAHRRHSIFQQFDYLKHFFRLDLYNSGGSFDLAAVGHSELLESELVVPLIRMLFRIRSLNEVVQRHIIFRFRFKVDWTSLFLNPQNILDVGAITTFSRSCSVSRCSIVGYENHLFQGSIGVG